MLKLDVTTSLKFMLKNSNLITSYKKLNKLSQKKITTKRKDKYFRIKKQCSRNFFFNNRTPMTNNYKHIQSVYHNNNNNYKNVQKTIWGT